MIEEFVNLLKTYEISSIRVGILALRDLPFKMLIKNFKKILNVLSPIFFDLQSLAIQIKK